MHKALHNNVSRKEGGGEFGRNQDSVDTLLQQFKDYIKRTRKTDYSNQKLHKHKHQPNSNN